MRLKVQVAAVLRGLGARVRGVAVAALDLTHTTARHLGRTPAVAALVKLVALLAVKLTRPTARDLDLLTRALAARRKALLLLRVALLGLVTADTTLLLHTQAVVARLHIVRDAPLVAAEARRARVALAVAEDTRVLVRALLALEHVVGAVLVRSLDRLLVLLLFVARQSVVRDVVRDNQDTRGLKGLGEVVEEVGSGHLE